MAATCKGRLAVLLKDFVEAANEGTGEAAGAWRAVPKLKVEAVPKLKAVVGAAGTGAVEPAAGCVNAPNVKKDEIAGGCAPNPTKGEGTGWTAAGATVNA